MCVCVCDARTNNESACHCCSFFSLSWLFLNSSSYSTNSFHSSHSPSLPLSVPHSHTPFLVHSLVPSITSSLPPYLPPFLSHPKRANSDSQGPFLKGPTTSFNKLSRFFGEDPPRLEDMETFLEGLGYSHLYPVSKFIDTLLPPPPPPPPFLPPPLPLPLCTSLFFFSFFSFPPPFTLFPSSPSSSYSNLSPLPPIYFSGHCPPRLPPPSSSSYSPSSTAFYTSYFSFFLLLLFFPSCSSPSLLSASSSSSSSSSFSSSLSLSLSLCCMHL